jgi:CO/xanthine dehydrogenase FAD-binding subunit
VLIGACTTHTQLLEHRLIADGFPILKRAIAVLASPPVRNMGTIGGNIVNASPAGDTLPPLYVLDGEVEIRSRSRTTKMKVDEFITGPGRTALRRGEIVSGVKLVKTPGYNIHYYEKVGTRRSQTCAVVSLAALLSVDGGGVIEAVRLAWGSIGPTVVTLPQVEEEMKGKGLSRETLAAAAKSVSGLVCPIDDIRATADYRRAVAGRLLFRLENLPIR